MAALYITDEDLELYALDRLGDAAPVEEHLLVCEECRERLAGWDAYVRAARTIRTKGLLARDPLAIDGIFLGRAIGSTAVESRRLHGRGAR
jgi:hypothetical protein